MNICLNSPCCSVGPQIEHGAVNVEYCTNVYENSSDFPSGQEKDKDQDVKGSHHNNLAYVNPGFQSTVAKSI